MGSPQISLRSAMSRPTSFRPTPFNVASLARMAEACAADHEESLEQAHSRGVAEGRELAEISHAIERKALLDLLASAEAFHHESSDDLATIIVVAVEALVQQIVSNAPIDREWLMGQAAAAAAIVADADHDRILHLHPVDAALVADCDLGMPVRTNAELARGEVQIETGSGWTEAGPSIYLDAIRAALSNEGKGA